MAVRCISCFRGSYSFLSNFYNAPIIWNSRSYPTAEHLFQCRKTSNSEFMEKIREAPTASEAKHLGRIVSLRLDWEDVKYNIMDEIVHAKFYQHPDLAQRLIATGNIPIMEGNTWHDNYWGDCRCTGCQSTPGLNMLGIILMNLREELKYSKKRLV